MSPRAGLDAEEWEIYHALARNRTVAVEPVARIYTD
jgi:hypothetical protein